MHPDAAKYQPPLAYMSAVRPKVRGHWSEVEQDNLVRQKEADRRAGHKPALKRAHVERKAAPVAGSLPAGTAVETMVETWALSHDWPAADNLRCVEHRPDCAVRMLTQVVAGPGYATICLGLGVNRL